MPEGHERTFWGDGNLPYLVWSGVSQVYTFAKNIKWNISMESVLFCLVSGKSRHLNPSPGFFQNIVWIPYNHLLLVSRFFVYFVSQQTLVIISSSFIKKKTSRNYTMVVSMKELLKFPCLNFPQVKFHVLESSGLFLCKGNTGVVF